MVVKFIARATVLQAVFFMGICATPWESSLRAEDKRPESEQLFQLEGAVYSVAVAPDGGLIAAGGHTSLIHLFSPSEKTVIAKLAAVPKGAFVQRLTFSPDGQMLAAACSDGRARLWDTAKRTVLLEWGRDGQVGQELAFTPDGRSLAVACNDGRLRLLAVNDGKEILAVGSDSERIVSIAFAPGGRHVYAACNRLQGSSYAGGSIRCWEIPSGKESPSIAVSTTDDLRAIVLDSKAQSVAVCGTDVAFVRLFSTVSGKEIRQMQKHDKCPIALAISPRGQLIASSGCCGEPTIRLGEAASGQEIMQCKGPEGYVFTLAFAPDGKLVSGHGDGSVHKWPLDQAR
jgi:WD40 repeat protein